MQPIDSNLRMAQQQAVRQIESTFSRGHLRALVQMATGTGKTMAAVAAMHRLIHHARARRVLVLVDTLMLGQQMINALENYPMPQDGGCFGDTYSVARLDRAGLLPGATVVVATIQGLANLLRGDVLDEEETAEGSISLPVAPLHVKYNSLLPPDCFDLVVVDECHRSIHGQWRPLLEYFDARIIGLTATPVAQTFGFFNQNLVFEYGYQQAISDGVIVDFDMYCLKADAAVRGDGFLDGEVLSSQSLSVGREWSEVLEPDFPYVGSQVGKSLLASQEIVAVLEVFRDRLFVDLFPGRNLMPKTLILAQSDRHADEILSRVRDIFGLGDASVIKITATERNPKELLRRFRHDPETRIAVAIDLIDSGANIRALECIIFMRAVRSASHFERILGVGALTISASELQAVTPDAKGKDRFVVVDAAGIADSPWFRKKYA